MYKTFIHVLLWSFYYMYYCQFLCSLLYSLHGFNLLTFLYMHIVRHWVVLLGNLQRFFFFLKNMLRYSSKMWLFFLLYKEVFYTMWNHESVICICWGIEVNLWLFSHSNTPLTFNTTFDVCLVLLFRMHKYIFCN